MAQICTKNARKTLSHLPRTLFTFGAYCLDISHSRCVTFLSCHGGQLDRYAICVEVIYPSVDVYRAVLQLHCCICIEVIQCAVCRICEEPSSGHAVGIEEIRLTIDGLPAILVLLVGVLVEVVQCALSCQVYDTKYFKLYK